MDAYLAGSKSSTKFCWQKKLIEIHHRIYSKPWGELPVPYAACPKNRFPFGSCPRSSSTSETFQKQLGQEASSSPWRSPIRRTWCRPFGAGKWETWHPLWWSLQTLSLCSTLNAVIWAPNYKELIHKHKKTLYTYLILFTYLRWSCETEVSESCRFLVIGKWSPAFRWENWSTEPQTWPTWYNKRFQWRICRSNWIIQWSKENVFQIPCRRASWSRLPCRSGSRPRSPQHGLGVLCFWYHVSKVCKLIKWIQ